MKQKIKIEKFGIGRDRFAVYSDLEPWRIEKIDGVASVSDTMLDEGYLIVSIDIRYSVTKVLDEIRELVK